MDNVKIGTNFDIETDTVKVIEALTDAHSTFETLKTQACPVIFHRLEAS
jgi:hypothetical protein